MDTTFSLIFVCVCVKELLFPAYNKSIFGNVHVWYSLLDERSCVISNAGIDVVNRLTFSTINRFQYVTGLFFTLAEP